MKDNQNNKTGGTKLTYALEKTSNLDLKQASDNEVCKGVYKCIHTVFSLYFAANMYVPTYFKIALPCMMYPP